MAGQFEVMIERNFSSAHQLRGYQGKCENLHGHNYKIEIYARGSELNNIGLLVDFVELKQAADQIVTYLDHKNLNELDPFVTEQNPSAENVARFVLERIASKIDDGISGLGTPVRLQRQFVKERGGTHPGQQRMEPIGAHGTHAQMQIQFCRCEQAHSGTLGAGHQTVKRARRLFSFCVRLLLRYDTYPCGKGDSELI